MGSGRVEPLDALYRVVELVVREDGVRVLNLVHVWEAWCMVKKGWLWLRMDMVVYLDGGAASVFPCVEGVGGGEGADGFDGGSELRFCGVGVPWAGAGVSSCVIGE